VAFAERVLPKASELSVHASLDQQQRLQQMFFPERVPFDGNRFSRTAVNAAAFSYSRPIQQGGENVVSRAGIELSSFWNECSQNIHRWRLQFLRRRRW
jgi:hypothetical protein